jgi:hypothetical protein
VELVNNALIGDVEAIYVQPVLSDIRLEWDWVNIGVREILEDQPTYTYRPEDVYSSCIKEESYLFTQDKTKFAIVSITVDKYTTDKTLFMWLCWVDPKVRVGKNILRHIDFFETIAKNEGCRYLETVTTSKALSRLYTSVGMDLTAMHYRREIGVN